MSKRPIYLDYMASTPIDPNVISQMLIYMGPDADFGNPASVQHSYGQDASIAVENARNQIALSIGAMSQEIVFTSGATEATNLAILGAARFYQRKGRHIITLTTEHKTVLDSFKQLEQEGFEVTYIAPQSTGLLNISDLEKSLRTDTILVSIMHVNNEIGVIQDIAAIGALLKNKGIIFHVDAAQSAGKLPIDVSAFSVNLMSLSAHKNYGPKGAGALYVCQKPRIRLQPQSFGGGQERGLRSGTLPTHQIVGMGAAFALSESIRQEEQDRILSLRNKLWDGICHIPGIQLNGCIKNRIAGNLNISFNGIDGASLLPRLHDIAVSSSSACSSSSLHPSYVLRALGLDADLAKSSIRISIGRFTTEHDIEKTISILIKQIKDLQRHKI